MSDQQHFQSQTSVQTDGKGKIRGQILLTPPARKLRMSRKKVEH